MSVRTASMVISALELLLITALYLFFIVKDRLLILGLMLLAVCWLLRWLMLGRPTAATPFDMPIFGLLLMLMVSWFITSDHSLTLPKVSGSILGMAIFYAIVNSILTERRFKLAVAALVFLGAGMAAVGLIGTDWANTRIFNISQIYAHLPRLINDVTRSIQGGFHHNVVGGTLIFFIPLQVNLLWGRRTFNLRGLVSNSRWDRFVSQAYLPVLIISLVLTFITLILTQSRGSIIGLGVALLLVAAWHDRRFLWGFGAPILIVLVLMRVVGSANLIEFVTGLDSAPGNTTLPFRLEIWQRALLLIRDFPFTGIGIGTFYPVLQALYPFFNNITPIPHAHNIVLNTAVDLGIPGLVLYFSLLSAFAGIAWKAYRLNIKFVRLIIVGLACGMLAHLIFGITDSFELGTKSGAILWIFLALASVLYLYGRRHVEITVQPARSPTFARRLALFLLVFGFWAVASLLSITFISLSVVLALAIAVLAGIALGFFSVQAFEFGSAPASFTTPH